MNKLGYVYLLEEFRNEERAFKIGFTTTTVEKRVKSMQTGNSDEIVICYKYKTKNYLRLEKMMHIHFASKHKRGEWFSMSDSQALSFLDKCKEKDDTINFMMSSDNPFF